MAAVVVYFVVAHTRSNIVANAMFEGIGRCGDEVCLKPATAYRGPDADCAVFYGLAGNLHRALAEYPERKRTAVYIDLGYWGRRKKTRWDGYHKLVINGRHPTDYFQRRPMPDNRFRDTQVQIEPWRKSGKHIVVAGMSAKASLAEGLLPEQWERAAIAELHRHTKRPIVYRPKPNWSFARPIPGSHFETGVRLEDSLKDCHAVVSHHSNVAIEALCMGIPAFVIDGAARPMALNDLSKIETPFYPTNRRQWLADLAWTQFSLAEMKDGTAWRHLKSEGLVP